MADVCCSKLGISTIPSFNTGARLFDFCCNCPCHLSELKLRTFTSNHRDEETVWHIGTYKVTGVIPMVLSVLSTEPIPGGGATSEIL